MGTLDDLYSDQTSSNGNQSNSGSGISVDSSSKVSNSQGANVSDLLFLVGYVLLGILSFVLLIYISLKILRKYFHNRNKLKKWKKTIFMEISVPLETAEESKKDSGSEKSEEKDIIGIGEQIFLVMSEYAKGGLGGWLFGTERFSLEIVNIDQKIRFWIVCSDKTADVIERQIVATYPKVDIARFNKTNFFKEGAVGYAQEYSLATKYELPFRTYTMMEKDPLNTITNALTGLSANESAALQIVVTPETDIWQKNPRILAAKIQQGQNPQEILYPKWSSVFFKGLKEFFKIFKSNNKKDDPYSSQKEERNIDLSGRREAVQLTPQQQEIIKRLEEKASRPGFDFTLRVVAAADNEPRARQIVNGIAPAFQIFDINPFNSFKKKKTDSKKAILNFLLRAPNLDKKEILNTEELNSLWHLPNYLVKNSSINWLLAKKPPIPINLPGPEDPKNVYLGKAKAGMMEKDVYMKTEDRFRHIYALGGSGSGKSVFMENLVLQDIKAGNGVCVVDPHGETVDNILLNMPKERKDDVIVFSPAITDFPLGLNMLETNPDKPTEKTLVIDIMFKIWDKLYDLKATGGPMFESYMKNAMRLVMGHPESGSTLMEIARVLTDEDYRAFKLAMCDDQEVVDFWEKEAEKAGGEAALENIVPYITSKLAPFITNDFIRPMVGQQKSAINFREAMDTKKIVLVKLEKGLIGETSAYLVGMVMVGNLLMAGMGRNDGMKYNEDGTKEEILPKDRPPFFIYIDEMQNFLFDAIPQALEEIRKYKVGFCLAHQFVKQIISKGDERIKDSVLANCASKFIFRAGAEDAELLLKEFSPYLSSSDLQNPEKFTCNAILLVDGQKTTPFNIAPPPPSEHPDVEFKKELIAQTKQKYGKPLPEIEKEIKERVEKFMF